MTLRVAASDRVSCEPVDSSRARNDAISAEDEPILRACRRPGASPRVGSDFTTSSLLLAKGIFKYLGRRPCCLEAGRLLSGLSSSAAHFRPPSDLQVLAPLGPAVAALRSNGYVDRFPKAISSGNTFWLRTGCRLF